jgi:hypothetical protein
MTLRGVMPGAIRSASRAKENFCLNTALKVV